MKLIVATLFDNIFLIGFAPQTFILPKQHWKKNLRQHCIFGITGEVSEIVEDLREIWETFYFHIYWGIFEHTWASSFLSFFLSQRRFYPTCLTSLFGNICTSIMFWFCTRLKPDLFWIRILTFSLLKKITGFLHWFVFHILGMDCVVSNVISRKVKSGSPTCPTCPSFLRPKSFFVQKFQFPCWFKGVAKFISLPQWKFKLGCEIVFFPSAKKAFKKPSREWGGREALEKIQSNYYYAQFLLLSPSQKSFIF